MRSTTACVKAKLKIRAAWLLFAGQFNLSPLLLPLLLWNCEGRVQMIHGEEEIQKKPAGYKLQAPSCTTALLRWTQNLWQQRQNHWVWHSVLFHIADSAFLTKWWLSAQRVMMDFSCWVIYQNQNRLESMRTNTRSLSPVLDCCQCREKEWSGLSYISLVYIFVNYTSVCLGLLV